jgi:ATP-binding cassette subfamily G (WHITE) protein 2 (PDR)
MNEGERVRTLTLEEWLLDKQQNRRTNFGVAFKELHVKGFMAAGHYQSTMSSYILNIPRTAIKLFSKRYSQQVQILRSCNGLVGSGEMLLVLGRPGSGCSTFLKTLAGDTQGIYVENSSSINYEGEPFSFHPKAVCPICTHQIIGIPYDSMHYHMKGKCIYTTELDVHFPEMTTGQTLAFAADMRPNRQSREPYGSQITSQTIASLFNLQNAFHTVVGNAMIRGISGGEKKRTSIAEAFLNESQLQCWDNSIRGLDSSTALKFVKLLRAAADMLKTTTLTTMYQASERIYQVVAKVLCNGWSLTLYRHLIKSHFCTKAIRSTLAR